MQVERWNFEGDVALSELGLRRKTDKIDAVIARHFRITIGREQVLLGAGDAIYVPSGVEHRAEVMGENAVASLDAVKNHP
jgi:mannose-6-phosphate isomerase-like protein (cupin superfamily)